MTTPPSAEAVALPQAQPQQQDFASEPALNATVSTPVPHGGPTADPPQAPRPHRSSTAPSTRPGLSASRTQRLTWEGGLSPAQRQRARRPAFNQNYSQLSLQNDDCNAECHVSPGDGRVHISVNALKEGTIARLLPSPNLHESTSLRPAITEQDNPGAVQHTPPKLNIVVMVVGSRGDVQPFVAIAKELVEKWGHRVRLATHGTFREFVEKNGVEFYDIGGNPQQLMSFMVRNPGLIPSLDTIKSGDVAKHREQMASMFEGLWRACVEPDAAGKRRKSTDSGSAASAFSSIHRRPSNVSASSDEDLDALVPEDGCPFIADAIIANPPSFAHIHCAEKLGIPLHLMFTFPYSPTQSVPHPLAFIKNSNLASGVTNELTYTMVDMMTWQGLGDLINRFRQQTLGLEPIDTWWAPGMLSRLKVPFTYMWSPALIPKPADWGPHIDITGFVFLDQTKNYEPPKELEKFLESGPPPVYIGFGSIVVDDPEGLTKKIFDAVKETGVRALVSKGWGGIGGEGDIPDNIYMLGNTPHDWLFPKVSAVVHHGGAGTTAIGLKEGKPTMIVPFFGDQQFWGTMVSNANAGPEPVPHKELTTEKLVEGIRALLSEECQAAAKSISQQINQDDGNGAKNAVQSFFKGIDELRKGHRGLERSGLLGGEGGPRGPGEGKWGSGGPGLRCDMLEENVAVWRIKKTRTRLSALAACYLIKHGKLTVKELRLVRHTEWNDFDGPGEPISGGISAFFASMTSMAKGAIGVPIAWYKGAKRVEEEGLPLELNPAHLISPRHSQAADAASPPCISTETAQTGASSSSPQSKKPPPRHRSTIGHDVAHGTKHSLAKLGRAGARAPLDVTLAVAQGFHNAPRLYGDEVRRPYRVTGFHSGMRAAGKEFALGLYDGFTGVVVQPYRGAKTEGVKGFSKGVGKGLGGLVFKTNAGTAGLIAFSLKGVHKEMRKGRDRRWAERIKKARLVQGEKLLAGLTAEEREDVKLRCEEGWKRVVEERKQRAEDDKLVSCLKHLGEHRRKERDAEGRILEPNHKRMGTGRLGSAVKEKARKLSHEDGEQS